MPLTFRGKTLKVNYATSAGGSVRVEIQDEEGNPVPGFALNDCTELIGDHVEQSVTWRGGSVSELTSRSVKLRFVLRDADVYSWQFQPAD